MNSQITHLYHIIKISINKYNVKFNNGSKYITVNIQHNE